MNDPNVVQVPILALRADATAARQGEVAAADVLARSFRRQNDF